MGVIVTVGSGPWVYEPFLRSTVIVNVPLGVVIVFMIDHHTVIVEFNGQGQAGCVEFLDGYLDNIITGCRYLVVMPTCPGNFAQSFPQPRLFRCMHHRNTIRTQTPVAGDIGLGLGYGDNRWRRNLTSGPVLRLAQALVLR